MNAVGIDISKGKSTVAPTIKLRFKARQPAASFSISKPKLLEWESKLPDIAHLGPTRP